MCGTMKGDLRWHQQEREKDQSEITRLRAALAAAEAERDALRMVVKVAVPPQGTRRVDYVAAMNRLIEIDARAALAKEGA